MRVMLFGHDMMVNLSLLQFDTIQWGSRSFLVIFLVYFLVFLKITNNKKIGAAFKIDAGGDDQLVIFFTWPNNYDASIYLKTGS